jgi:septum formation protein
VDQKQSSVKETGDSFILILGSSSPRRRELCARIGLPIVTYVPDIEEESFSDAILRSPQEITTSIALHKLDAIEKKIDNETAAFNSEEKHLILTADTMVFFGKEAMGKPRDALQAEKMLLQLSGKWHDVYTGVCIKINWDESHSQKMYFCERTRVKFRKIPIEVIRKYIASGTPFDKAGGYGIQDEGSVFVEQIAGDYYNVMGLPLGRIWELLYNNGVIR